MRIARFMVQPASQSAIPSQTRALRCDRFQSGRHQVVTASIVGQVIEQTSVSIAIGARVGPTPHSGVVRTDYSRGRVKHNGRLFCVDSRLWFGHRRSDITTLADSFITYGRHRFVTLSTVTSNTIASRSPGSCWFILISSPHHAEIILFWRYRPAPCPSAPTFRYLRNQLRVEAGYERLR